MAFIPAIGVAKVCLHLTVMGQNMQLCLHFKKTTGTPSDADLAALAQAASDGWQTFLKPNFGTFLDHVYSVATDLTTQSGHQATNTPASPVPGTGGSTPISNGSAAVATWRTAGRGRSRRGRTYLPGLSSAWVANAITLDPTAISAVLADLASYTAALEAATSPTYNHVIVSKQENLVAQDPANTYEVTAVTMDTFIDSQRRRLGGRGT